jgi:DNA repair exonuclease SbcCD ATPase subunit
MTSQQLRGETVEWVHREIAEVKNQIALLIQRMDHTAGLASDTADRGDRQRQRIDYLETQAKAIPVLLEELRAGRDTTSKLHDELVALRQAVEELSRHRVEDVTRLADERNEITRKFSETVRMIDAVREKISGYDEQHRRALEASAQAALKLEAIINEQAAQATRHSRLRNGVTRMDQELTRISTALESLIQEDQTLKERVQSVGEFLRRLEGEAEALRGSVARIDRIDDRLELVQAERSRHGERLTELTNAIADINAAAFEQTERTSLIEARMGAIVSDINDVDAKLNDFREKLAVYLRSITKSEGDFRKRNIAALEKEVREIRGRSIDFVEE